MTPGNSETETNKLLAQMLAELKGTNQRLDATNQRLDATNQRLELVRTELKAEIVQTRTEAAQNLLASETRIATRVLEQTIATRNLYDMLMNQLDLRDRVERCETQIAELQRTQE